MADITVDGDLLLTDPPLLDSTGRALVAEQVKQTALLSVLADQAPKAALLADWNQAGAAIQAGAGEYIFPIGSHFSVDWSTVPSQGGASAAYAPRLDIVHHGQGALASGERLNVVRAQWHHVLPFDTQFSPYQAFLYAIDGLPAGTYNVTMGFNWGTNVVNGKTYQFTLAQALPAGGQLCGFDGAPDQAPSNWRVYSFASQTATTATETATVSEGSAGTNLGTFTVAGEQVVPASGTPASSSSATIGGSTYSYYGLNSLHRVAYGNNRWLHSPLRQYLNASGYSWWEPATVFDRPPAYASRQGFLSGFDDEFLARVQPIERVTALSYAVDGGTSSAPAYDTTYDMFSLPSGVEHNLADTASFGGGQGAEGDPWEYWQRVAGSSAPLAWSTWGNVGTYHPEYIQYDLAAQTAARFAWMRSAHRGAGYGVTVVTSQGTCNYRNAIYGHRAAPDCAIG